LSITVLLKQPQSRRPFHRLPTPRLRFRSLDRNTCRRALPSRILTYFGIDQNMHVLQDFQLICYGNVRWLRRYNAADGAGIAEVQNPAPLAPVASSSKAIRYRKNVTYHGPPRLQGHYITTAGLVNFTYCENRLLLASFGLLHESAILP
jgi:hypothetical protein